MKETRAMKRVDKLTEIFQTYSTVVGVEYRKSSAIAFIQFDKGEDGEKGAKKLFSFLKTNRNSSPPKNKTKPIYKEHHRGKLVGYKTIEIHDLPRSVISYLRRTLGGKEVFEKKLGEIVGEMMFHTGENNYKAIGRCGKLTGDKETISVHISNKSFDRACLLTKRIHGATLYGLIYYAIIRYLEEEERRGTVAVKVRIWRSIADRINNFPMGIPISSPVKLWKSIMERIVSTRDMPRTESELTRFISAVRGNLNDYSVERLVRVPLEEYKALRETHNYSNDLVAKQLAYQICGLFYSPDKVVAQPQQQHLSFE